MHQCQAVASREGMIFGAQAAEEVSSGYKDDGAHTTQATPLTRRARARAHVGLSTLWIGLKMPEKSRGHAHPAPLGPYRLLAPACLGAGARPLWAGLGGGWCRNAVMGIGQSGGQRLALLLPRPPPSRRIARAQRGSERNSIRRR